MDRLNDERMLEGFGNNGGEEFLSYMLTSEAFVVTGGEKWTKWTDKMHERLAKIQNPDGSCDWARPLGQQGFLRVARQRGGGAIPCLCARPGRAEDPG